ncbi:MAG: transposase family protein [Deinococcota bacterium]
MRAAQKKQRRWYSGKKKRHPLKLQVLVNVATLMIMSVASTFGSMHDLTLFRTSGVRLPLDTALISNAGYQGIGKDHPHAITPHQATTTAPLTDEVRQGVEHHRLKIFRIFKGVYRHRRRRFALRLHPIAALCNLTLARST